MALRTPDAADSVPTSDAAESVRTPDAADRVRTPDAAESVRAPRAATVQAPDLPDRLPAADAADDENKAVDLARLAWLVTVLACLIAVVILLLQGYYGYATVTFAVAASAAINLL